MVTPTGQYKAALDLLKRLRGWDMMDATADGPYWRAAIDEVLHPHGQRICERERCRHPFYPADPRQMFCCKKCGNANRRARLRAASKAA